VNGHQDLPSDGHEAVAAATTESDRVRRPSRRQLAAEYLRLTPGPSRHCTCTQIFQFWRRPTSWMMHQVGRIMADHSLFREQSYQALSRQDAARRADLGTYQA
jgi:hypothetical protein